MDSTSGILGTIQILIKRWLTLFKFMIVLGCACYKVCSWSPFFKKAPAVVTFLPLGLFFANSMDLASKGRIKFDVPYLHRSRCPRFTPLLSLSPTDFYVCVLTTWYFPSQLSRRAYSGHWWGSRKRGGSDTLQLPPCKRTNFNLISARDSSNSASWPGIETST